LNFGFKDSDTSRLCQANSASRTGLVPFPDDYLAALPPILLYSFPMDYLLLLGLLAATLTTVAYVPQLLKVIKTRSTHDISLAMYIVVCTGVLLWLIYGILIHNTPIIVANAITFVIACAVLVMKIRYK
jgi:MtN3 and saliva related transmembrane protein